MSRTIIAITTTINGTKKYVTDSFPRFDNKRTVELSANDHEAKDFNTVREAGEFVTKIFNPFERVFTVEQLKVRQPEKIVTTKTQSWLEERVIK